MFDVITIELIISTIIELPGYSEPKAARGPATIQKGIFKAHFPVIHIIHSRSGAVKQLRLEGIPKEILLNGSEPHRADAGTGRRKSTKPPMPT